jgi:hypothetical protein
MASMLTFHSPYKFENPWDKFEFAHHCLDFGAHVIILPMAWLTHDDPREYSRMPQEPDMTTLMYWVSRLEPIVRLESDREIIVIFANRTGVEGEVTYAGTSAVVGIKDGEVLVYGVLGRGDKELLVVDTDEPPFARLVHTNQSPAVPPGGQDSHDPGDSESSDGGSYRREEADRLEDEAMKPSVEPRSEVGQPSGSKYEGTASRSATSHNDGGTGSFNSELIDRDPSELRSRNESSLDHMDILERYLEEQPSRASSSNGYLNSHIGYPYDGKSSVGKTPDSIRARRGSGSDMGHLPQESSISTRKPTWGQLPPKKENEDDTRWNVSDDDAADGLSDNDWKSDVDVPPWGRENRHSFCSDVSVWNNFSGQSKPAGAPSTPRSQMITQKVEDYLRGSTPRSESQQDVRRFTEPAPTKGLETTPRHQTSSRTREYGRPDTSTTGRKQSGLSNQIHNADDRYRAGSARGTSATSSTQATQESTPQRRDSQTRAKIRSSSSAKVNPPSAIRNGLETRAASIPIAMDRGVSRESSLGRRPPPAPVDDDLPILRPASRSRLRAGSDTSRGRTVETPLTKVISSNSAQAVATSSVHKETRQLSRGRQRGTRSALDQHQLSRHGPPRTSHSAQNNRRGSVEPVDLSQFHLIEEFPSASCPVHGSRSRSAARHQTGTGSRRRPSTDGHRRPGSRDVRESRRTAQNTPAHQTGGAIGPVSTPSKGVGSAPRRKSSRDLNASRRMTQSVQMGVAESRRNGGSTLGDDIVTTEVTRLDLKHGPKTPVAMVLVGGDKEQQTTKPDARDGPAANSFGIKGSNMRPARPRSAVW